MKNPHRKGINVPYFHKPKSIEIILVMEPAKHVLAVQMPQLEVPLEVEFCKTKFSLFKGGTAMGKFPNEGK